MSDDVRNKLETLLDGVHAGRRAALRRLLLGTGVVALVAPVATLLADDQDTLPEGRGRGGKGKGDGKGKGKAGKGKGSPGPGRGRGGGRGA